MQFGRLDQTAQSIAVPRLQTTNQKQLLEYAQVLAGCLFVQANLTAELGEIGQLPRVLRKDTQQSVPC